MKILRNVAFNPISTLTGATLAAMALDPGVNALVRSIMAEVEAVAERLGLDLPISIEQRIAGAENVGDHKTACTRLLCAINAEPTGGRRLKA